jgi:hypothetical protein
MVLVDGRNVRAFILKWRSRLKAFSCPTAIDRWSSGARALVFMSVGCCVDADVELKLCPKLSGIMKWIYSPQLKKFLGCVCYGQSALIVRSFRVVCCPYS